MHGALSSKKPQPNTEALVCVTFRHFHMKMCDEIMFVVIEAHTTCKHLMSCNKNIDTNRQCDGCARMCMVRSARSYISTRYTFN